MKAIKAPSRQWAIVFGQGTYETGPHVQAAEQNSSAFAERLLSLGYQKGCVTHLTNTTRDQALDALDQVLTSIAPTDTVLFYFSGLAYTSNGRVFLSTTEPSGQKALSLDRDIVSAVDRVLRDGVICIVVDSYSSELWSNVQEQLKPTIADDFPNSLPLQQLKSSIFVAYACDGGSKDQRVVTTPGALTTTVSKHLERGVSLRACMESAFEVLEQLSPPYLSFGKQFRMQGDPELIPSATSSPVHGPTPTGLGAPPILGPGLTASSVRRKSSGPYSPGTGALTQSPMPSPTGARRRSSILQEVPFLTQDPGSMEEVMRVATPPRAALAQRQAAGNGSIRRLSDPQALGLTADPQPYRRQSRDAGQDGPGSRAPPDLRNSPSPIQQGRVSNSGGARARRVSDSAELDVARILRQEPSFREAIPGGVSNSRTLRQEPTFNFSRNEPEPERTSFQPIGPGSRLERFERMCSMAKEAVVELNEPPPEPQAARGQRRLSELSSGMLGGTSMSRRRSETDAFFNAAAPAAPTSVLPPEHTASTPVQVFATGDAWPQEVVQQWTTQGYAITGVAVRDPKSMVDGVRRGGPSCVVIMTRYSKKCGYMYKLSTKDPREIVRGYWQSGKAATLIASVLDRYLTVMMDQVVVNEVNTEHELMDFGTALEVTSAQQDAGNRVACLAPSPEGHVMALWNEHGGRSQGWQTSRTFPHGWVERNNKEGLIITAVTYIPNAKMWWVTMDRPTIPYEQEVIVEAAWDEAAARQKLALGYRASVLAFGEGTWVTAFTRPTVPAKASVSNSPNITLGSRLPARRGSMPTERANKQIIVHVPHDGSNWPQEQLMSLRGQGYMLTSASYKPGGIGDAPEGILVLTPISTGNLTYNWWLETGSLPADRLSAAVLDPHSMHSLAIGTAWAGGQWLLVLHPRSVTQRHTVLAVEENCEGAAWKHVIEEAWSSGSASITSLGFRGTEITLVGTASTGWRGQSFRSSTGKGVPLDDIQELYNMGQIITSIAYDHSTGTWCVVMTEVPGEPRQVAHVSLGWDHTFVDTMAAAGYLVTDVVLGPGGLTLTVVTDKMLSW